MLFLAFIQKAQRVSSTMLSLRRETARSTQRTLLQRFNLDILAVVVAVVGFVFLEYLLNTGILNTQLNLLLLAPLTLLSIFFLALAGILLFMRLYPLLLRLGAWVTMRSRSAAPMLALAQMARAPRQAVRTTLLLSLATACMLFLLIFMASQSQRIADVAAYQTGADISGTVRDNGFTSIDRQQLTSQYRHVPGILSASVGYVTSAGANVGSVYQLPVQMNAVDSDTFAQTAFWPQQNAGQPLSAIMKQFSAQRTTSIGSNLVPAAVDTAMWNALQLTPGAHFTLIFNDGNVINGSVNFVAEVEVNHIPTINDSTVASDTTDIVADGGMLVDYQTYAQVYIHDFFETGAAVPINYVWLKTRSDNASLLHVRNVLSDPKGCCVQLLSMYDRRAIAVNLQNDPLYLDIIGLLSMGTLITIVLLLLGNLIASWLNVRNRLAQFAVLHALGATSRQVSSILLWEQGISYATGIVLGLLFGFLLAIFLLPSLVYTGVVSSGVGSDLSTAQFYLIQNAPPIQVVLPPWLLLLLVVLLLIFAATFMLIVRVIAKLSSAQILRLNVD
ncbi:MAG: FtsX-like permease family protein [Ktedonobacteraceae bacterium]